MHEMMLVGLPLGGMMRLAWEHGICGVSIGLLSGIAWRSCRREKDLMQAGARERRMREELEAYSQLDGSAALGVDTKKLARQVCRTVVDKSVFRRVAMLACDAEGKLYVAGSAGMDDLAVIALREWGAEAVRQDRGLGESVPEHVLPRVRVAPHSFLVMLDGPLLRAGRGCKRVIMTMMRGQNGAVLGALAVCADAIEGDDDVTMADALPPIEALAARLARSMENALLIERLMRAEKLAGLGQLAGGVAHELNHPLTAVLGFAEMIAETATDARVKQDSGTILREALRMKQTVESLLHFWRPPAALDEAVALDEMLAELARDCQEALDGRGVKLVVQAAAELPQVQGNRDRLRHVLQHLLNNAAQAIASSQEGRRAGDARRTGLPRGSDELDRSPEIRVTVREDGKILQMIVSDTGPGFPDAARAFDPFYTTRKPGGATGLGLSICYGIVREHGGEISAYNLHPHGAAVVVELPVRQVVAEEHSPAVLGHGNLLPSGEERMRRRQDQDQDVGQGQDVAQ
jgi:signal transduction histidine kinase